MQHESQLSSPDAPETVELELYAGVEDFRAKYELPSNMLLLCVALVHFNQPVSGRESQQVAKSFPGLRTGPTQISVTPASSDSACDHDRPSRSAAIRSSCCETSTHWVMT